IDLGSNTVSFALIDKNLRIIKAFEQIVGVASGVKKTGKISEISVQNLKNGLQKAQKIFDFNMPHQGVATGAWRVATNAMQILNEIKQEFGLNFQIISGETEAALTFIGIKNALNEINLADKKMVFIDLGGASTEIGDGKISHSFDFGIINFYESYPSLDEMRKNVSAHCKKAKQYLASFDKEIIALTSGVATTIVAYKIGQNYNNYKRESINGYEMNMDDFDIYLDEFLKFDDTKCDEILGKGRKNLVKAGIVILNELLRDEKARIINIDDGVKEGVGVAYHKQILSNFL
nr:disulfide bond formation protein DsbA [Campylobacter sp.]